MPGNCVLWVVKAIDRSFPGYRSIAFYFRDLLGSSCNLFSPSFTACHAPRRTDGNRIFLACIAYQADWCTSAQDTRYAPFPPRERDITQRTVTPCQGRFLGSCVFFKDRCFGGCSEWLLFSCSFLGVRNCQHITFFRILSACGRCRCLPFAALRPVHCGVLCCQFVSAPLSMALLSTDE